MSNAVNVIKAKMEAGVAIPAVPALLGFNVLALFAVDHVWGIASWVKMAAAIFLAF